MPELSSYAPVTTLAGTERIPVVTTPGVAGGNRYITAANLTTAILPQNVVRPSADTTGVTDTAATLAALAINGTVYLAPGDFYWTPLGTLAQGSRIVGAGRVKTIIHKAANGDIATLGEAVEVTDLTIDGEGATYTGRGFVISGVNGDQRLTHLKLIDFDGYCVEYTVVTAGSGSELNDVTAYRVSAGSGTGRYAIKIQDAVQLGAVPRVFHQLKTGGQCAVDFGGVNDCYVTASTLGDLLTSTNTRGLHIANSRLLSTQTTFNWAGDNCTLIGCDVYPQVILVSGADGNAIGPNSYQGGGLNSFPVIDNSGNDRNVVYYQEVAYTSGMGLALDSNGTAPVLGNGTLTARVSRNGNVLTVTYNFTHGSTSDVGNGNWGFVLPMARINGDIMVTGGGYLFDASAAVYYPLVVQVAGNVGKCSFFPTGAAVIGVSKVNPVTLANGDILRATFSYPI